jgi:NADH dehydrogenase (ubiquinone) 1 beta subcomplex subunit 11
LKIKPYLWTLSNGLPLIELFPPEKSFQYFLLGFICVSHSPLFTFFSKVDWGHREAMILLREREAAGIFPIDKNFIDPAKLELPTDEELGDTVILC